jgi:hypothetical protein
MLFTAYSTLCLSLAVLYAALLMQYVRGWRRLPTWSVPLGFAPKTSVTVLVPARNEAANISACLHAILACNYPQHLLEILVLDDFSTDDTARIVSEIATANAGQVRLIRLEEQPSPVFSGKKKALELGVSCARGELIATTDADCLVPADWLLLLVSLFEAKRPGAIVAPVMLHREHTGFQRFQALDFAGMMGITGAGIGMGWHRMGNGANLCYAKKTFEAVGGYAGNLDRASGDDLFLLGKIATPPPTPPQRGGETRHFYPKKIENHLDSIKSATSPLPVGEGAGVGFEEISNCATSPLPVGGGAYFLKNPTATVRTLPCPDLHTFVQQRLRWGTKNAGLPDPGLKAVLAVVFLHCCMILLNTVLLFFLPILGWVWLAQLALKAAADYVLLREMCTFFERRALLRGFLPAFFAHTAYIAGIGAGSLFVKKYVWKGRRVR